jgi:asparagine synthase (glutamine-hydrolysing)
MCGICGIAHSDGRIGDRELLREMNAAMRHRGPDSEGVFSAPGIGLGIRRLAIIDVAGGDQPISNEDGSIWIVLNGEIYNYPQMRAELERRGHTFKTKTDTECILHYYEDEGDACVHRLRGMFAFALWDANKQRLLIARDRMGQKPVFYSIHGGTLYFCSELDGLLRALPTRPSVQLEAIDLYLSLQYIPEPWTVYEGVKKLEAANTLVWQDGNVVTTRYWDFDYLPKLDGREIELIGELRERLRAIVKMRLMSEVPLGAHLSGGLDSSIVVGLMAELSDQPVKTFSVGFEEEEFSELPYARTIADQYGTDHHEYVLRYDSLPETLQNIARHFGEPFADASAIPLFYLSRITRRTVTVALNGDGGDENFAGYQRYGLDPLADVYLRAPGWVTKRLIPSVTRPLRDDSNRPTGASLVNGLRRLEQVSQVDRRASILRWGSYFSDERKRRLWRSECWETLTPGSAEGLLVQAYERGSGSKLDRTLYADTHTYLPGDLLVKADRMTMAASLEGRSPFLDHEFVAWAARLPDSLKVRRGTGKYLLKKAFEKDLPKNVREHRKQGFGIPLAAWFRGPLAAWARQQLLGSGSPLKQWFDEQALEQLLAEHGRGLADHGKRLYALSMLGIWAADANR